MTVKEEKAEMDGTVVDVLRAGMYRVALERGGHELLAYTTGKVRASESGS